jgi:hypothetical protein
MKSLVKLFDQNNFELGDDSKLHVYLSAILRVENIKRFSQEIYFISFFFIKNEAHFAFGFIALSGVDKLSLSIYGNLKVKVLI